MPSPPSWTVQGPPVGQDGYSIGDSVYIRGHGPGRVVGVREAGGNKFRYKIEYPDGSTYHLPASALAPHIRSEPEAARSPPPPWSPQSSRARLDLVRPAMSSPTRQLHMPNAIFNLVCTMCGGGMLSLPYAFRASGVLLGTFCLVVSGMASAFTIELLISCSRADGSDSYEQVVGNALGSRARRVSGILLFFLTFLVPVAYLVLIADLVGSVLTWCCFEVVGIIKMILMISVMLLVTPLCLQPSLSSMRILNAVGLLAIFFMAVAIMATALPEVGSLHTVWLKKKDGQIIGEDVKVAIRWFPASFGDAVYALPLFALSFLAHFNVLPAQSELRWPTRGRVTGVIWGTVVTCICFYACVGISGYLYAGDQTCGNALINFASDSPFLATVRISVAFCLMNNLPLLVLPCRTALHRLITRPQPSSSCSTEAPAEVTQSTIHVYTRGQEDAGSLDIFVPKTNDAFLPPLSRCRRITMTLCIIFFVTALACALPSVLIVWSLVGCTTCFVIAFMFPVIAWLRVRGSGAALAKRFAAWIVLVLAGISMVGSTVMTVLRLDASPCPG